MDRNSSGVWWNAGCFPGKILLLTWNYAVCISSFFRMEKTKQKKRSEGLLWKAEATVTFSGWNRLIFQRKKLCSGKSLQREFFSEQSKPREKPLIVDHPLPLQSGRSLFPSLFICLSASWCWLEVKRCLSSRIILVKSDRIYCREVWVWTSHYLVIKAERNSQPRDKLKPREKADLIQESAQWRGEKQLLGAASSGICWHWEGRILRSLLQ